jgi:hypothetical protein
MCALRYALCATPSIPTAVADLPPNLPVRRVWSPTITSTLVYGERDASLAQETDPRSAPLGADGLPRRYG